MGGSDWVISYVLYNPATPGPAQRLNPLSLPEYIFTSFQEMIEDADKDGTGTLDIIEFLQMMREKVKEQNKEDEIKEAFTVFDVVRFEEFFDI